MGSSDRPKRRDLLWKKAILHFSLCFSIGLVAGFFPLSLSSVAPTYATVSNPTGSPAAVVSEPAKLLILVTAAAGWDDPLRGAAIDRLSRMLRLVQPPVLWIVVEKRSQAVETAEMLRMTGIMYRELVFEGNFTDRDAEMEHQRKVALGHIEQHRLDGIVHFAELESVYDLGFFEEIRRIEVFGAWPVASVSASRELVTIEGPVCRSSRVLGWHLNTTDDDDHGEARTTRIGISGFAFNSSILWDPERWGRLRSDPDSSQGFMKLIQRLVMEEADVLALPPDCSHILLWRLHHTLTFNV